MYVREQGNMQAKRKREREGARERASEREKGKREREHAGDAFLMNDPFPPSHSISFFECVLSQRICDSTSKWCMHAYDV